MLLFRSSGRAILVLFCCWLCGCDPGAESLDEQKNPYFLAGKERVAERDYKGAIEAFEKAVESNPRSVQAHFELGVLYEQHSDQKEEDYVSAMFHYIQAIKLRPNDYPADNARQRLASCKRELVKAEALAPVAQNLMRELDKLKEENHFLRNQLDCVQLQSRRAATNRNEVAAATLLSAPRLTNGPPSPSRPSSSDAGLARDRQTPTAPAAGARTHTVKPGETLYSIARQYRVKLESLTSANPSLDAKRMKIGQLINLPST